MIALAENTFPRAGRLIILGSCTTEEAKTNNWPYMCPDVSAPYVEENTEKYVMLILFDLSSAFDIV